MPAKSSNQPDDAELVAICNSGEADAATLAFSMLYERHRDYVLRVAMRYAHDPEIAAEALQETFTWLLKRFPPPGPGIELTAQLRTFLYPIARNTAISSMRKSARHESAVADPDELPAAPAHDGNEDAIDRALAGLGARQREVVQLRFVDGLTLAEIASALDLPLGTIKSRLHNALKQLRETPEIKDLFEK
jgi:RNA polymerase sigma-70 factor (ECF subfamily)